MALLRAKVPFKLGKIALATHSLPDKFDPVHCVGFPQKSSQTPKLVTRTVEKVNKYQGPENFEFAGLIPPGFGGAALLDDSFHLIGIAVAVDPKDKHTLCSPAAEIRKLLAAHEEPKSAKPELEETYKDPESPEPNLANQLAEKYFESEPWMAHPKYIFRSEDTYFYFNEWSPSNGDKTAQFKPFAMIRIPQKPSANAKAFGIICDSATFQFDREYRFSGPHPYQFERGKLAGVVRKATDAGLKVIGEDLDYAKLAP